jgi:hypothetical protein
VASRLRTVGPRSCLRENLTLSDPTLIPHFEMRIDQQQPSKKRLEAIWDWMQPYRTDGRDWDCFR